MSIDDPLQQYVRSPMNIALHWNEELLLWEVIVRYRGKRIGVTQVHRLEDLGTIVFDYVSLAGDDPLDPNAAVTDSLLPHDANLTLARIRDAIVDFGQLGTPGANDQVTALDTIELIDNLLDAEPEPPSTSDEQVVVVISDSVTDEYVAMLEGCHESLREPHFTIDDLVEYSHGVYQWSRGRVRSTFTTRTTAPSGASTVVDTWVIVPDDDPDHPITITDVDRLRRPQA